MTQVEIDQMKRTAFAWLMQTAKAVALIVAGGGAVLGGGWAIARPHIEEILDAHYADQRAQLERISVDVTTILSRIDNGEVRAFAAWEIQSRINRDLERRLDALDTRRP